VEAEGSHCNCCRHQHVAYFSGRDLSVLPPWEALLKEEEVHQYVDHLRESKVDGVDGILTQLDRLDAALELLHHTPAG